jgi:hypothetical protein
MYPLVSLEVVVSVEALRAHVTLEGTFLSLGSTAVGTMQAVLR